MTDLSYRERRRAIEHYFDRTAAEAWARLTSTAPVSGVRATVRAGRDRMRATLLSWLPDDLSGRRILDAGCGTGALAIEAARRGAEVVAIDLSPTLVNLARERTPPELSRAALRPEEPQGGSVQFLAGDMLDPELGHFDHVVGMDSLIHYRPQDAVRVLGSIAPRSTRSLLFTFAPSTPLLGTMMSLGKLFPRGDRAPAIEPVREARLRRLIAAEPALSGWQPGRCERVASGFYISQALELVRR
ncbi:MAG TPA: magnesium protoporphyrin IX methyltransferase [Methylibium sp.]|uniref:magnesium protoporphyrin IX methyltransferase n=1 Tax=Methylibium sp. TaxID=2067992 RepID=UPI002DBFC3C6|nr:magnesium protoporphyrin IX methyltransferase [Methylibium sp.]HEU4457675.1 magnesium protoporphyrin IX methyltransferase [Methylibium sp.]